MHLLPHRLSKTRTVLGLVAARENRAELAPTSIRADYFHAAIFLAVTRTMLLQDSEREETRSLCRDLLRMGLGREGRFKEIGPSHREHRLNASAPPGMGIRFALEVIERARGRKTSRPPSSVPQPDGGSWN